MDVTPGAPWRPPTAGEHNGWEQARREFEQRNRDRKPNNLQTHRFSDDRLRIRNSSGSDLPRGSVLQIGDSLLNPENPPDGMMVNGIVPDGSCACYAILRYAIPNGEINEGHVTGVCFARVNVLDITHVRAAVVASGTNLESGIDGQYEILSTLTSTGMQEVWVAALHPCGQGDSEIFWPTLTSCLQPGGTAGATLNGVTITVRDPYYWNFAIPGERLPVHATGGGRGCGLSGENFRVIGSHGLMRYVQSTSVSPVNCVETGTAEPVEGSGNCEISYVNMTCDPIANGDTGLAFYDHSSQSWRLLSRSKAKVVHATLSEDMCPDQQASITEDSASAVDCCCSVEELAAISAADNPFELAGKAGDVVELAKNCSTGAWYVRQVLHRLETVVTRDDEAEDCAQLKTRRISTMWCEEPGEPITENATVLVDARINDSCDFQVQPTTVCVLSAGAAGEYVTRKASRPFRYVDTLARSGDTLLSSYSIAHTFCAGPRQDGSIPLCCDDPPPSSSDGGGEEPCVECGELLIPTTIGIVVTVHVADRLLSLSSDAEHDGTDWQIADDLFLLEDGVPTEISVTGSVSCEDGQFVATVTLTDGEESHEYTFSITPDIDGHSITGYDTQEAVDVPACPEGSGEGSHGTTVVRCGPNDDHLCIAFDAWEEEMHYLIVVHDCDGNVIWQSTTCGGVAAGQEDLMTVNPILAGAGDDWYVLITWYDDSGCANAVRTDVIPGPQASCNETPSECTVTFAIVTNSTTCDIPSSSDGGGGGGCETPGTPATIYGTISSPTGWATNLPTNIELTWDGTQWYWNAHGHVPTCNESDSSISVFCHEGVLKLRSGATMYSPGEVDSTGSVGTFPASFAVVCDGIADCALCGAMSYILTVDTSP